MFDRTADARDARPAQRGEDLRDTVLVKNAIREAQKGEPKEIAEVLAKAIGPETVALTTKTIAGLARDPQLDAADFARGLPEGPNRAAAAVHLQAFAKGVLGAKTTAELAGPTEHLREAIKLAGAPAVTAFLERGIPPRNPHPAALRDIPTKDKPIIHEVSGKTGDWNEELNNVRPNARYQVDGRYNYETDRLGRTVRAEGWLVLQKHDRNTAQQADSGREDRLPGDAGGHLIGSQFYGTGERFQMVAMDGRLNGNSKTDGMWGQMETRWANALRAGQKVHVDIRPVYPDDFRDDDIERRPEAFRVKYRIGENGPIVSVSMKNVPGGK